ncbi:MAG: hypothetical protein JXA87_13315 [Thermoleophilia bacterium]|nr:hypothetical protein [Thermoleophilia bacterium]
MVLSRPYRSMMVALLLVMALGLGGMGCFGGDGDTTSGTTRTTRATVGDDTGASLPEGLTTAQAEELSTFRSKDPFIPQAVAVTTTTAVIPTSTTQTGGGGGGTVTTATTAYRPTTSTTRPGGGGGVTTTTKPGSTATTVPAPTTTTTAPHLHTLRVLAIGDVGGAPAVTFKVDSGVYKDRRVGDVVSSSWGQIKVMDISTSSKVVTLLQGSETLVLAVGQVIFE